MRRTGAAAAFALLLAGSAARAPVAELSPAEAYRLVEDLFSEKASVRKKARESLVAAGDTTVAPALVEAVFFAGAGRADAIAVLEALLGEKHGERYHAWVEAIGWHTEIAPKPGYLGFKAKQYARIDLAFSEFLREDHPRTIRPEEIVWGGVRKDGIPALRNPKHVAASEATYLSDGERVFGVTVNGDCRAYPHRIMDWHEVANDVVGGRTVSLSYCTLCGSGILFDTTLAEGETYTFGSSGLLYRSNKLMYDHQTRTLWSNLAGEPVMGPLAGKGKKLRMLPLVVTTWGEWRRRHPDTRVLSLETGYRRDYSPGAAYGRYFASRETMFPVWLKPPGGLKDWIWAVEAGGKRKAYPIKLLLKRPILHDTVGGVAVVLLTDSGSEAVRVYETRGLRFREEHGALAEEGSGQKFRIEEEALVSEDGGERLPRLPGHRAYWFGLWGQFPGIELWTGD